MRRPGGAGDRIRFLLVTGGGLGLSPVAPGTFGTLGGVVLGGLCQAFLTGPALAAAVAVLGLGLLGVGCGLSAYVARALPGDDPGAFVLDEIVGFLLGLALLAAFVGDPSPRAHAVLFVLFRAFDVVKVPPANRLEHLPGAPGIMLDDVAAGIWAGLAALALHPLGLT